MANIRENLSKLVGTLQTSVNESKIELRRQKQRERVCELIHSDS